MSLDVDRAPSVSFDRTPPQDVAAEQCVLGAMMLSKDAIADVVERLREDDPRVAFAGALIALGVIAGLVLLSSGPLP